MNFWKLFQYIGIGGVVIVVLLLVLATTNKTAQTNQPTNQSMFRTK